MATDVLHDQDHYSDEPHSDAWEDLGGGQKTLRVQGTVPHLGEQPAPKKKRTPNKFWTLHLADIRERDERLGSVLPSPHSLQITPEGQLQSDADHVRAIREQLAEADAAKALAEKQRRIAENPLGVEALLGAEVQVPVESPGVEVGEQTHLPL